MTQTDWIGGGKTARPFKDIRNQRPTVAEQKAELALRLGALINKVPQRVAQGSVNVVREWRRARDAAAKIAGNSRASIPELTTQIANMERLTR